MIGQPIIYPHTIGQSLVTNPQHISKNILYTMTTLSDYTAHCNVVYQCTSWRYLNSHLYSSEFPLPYFAIPVQFHSRKRTRYRTAVQLVKIFRDTYRNGSICLMLALFGTVSKYWVKELQVHNMHVPKMRKII